MDKTKQRDGERAENIFCVNFFLHLLLIGASVQSECPHLNSHALSSEHQWVFLWAVNGDTHPRASVAQAWGQSCSVLKTYGPTYTLALDRGWPLHAFCSPLMVSLWICVIMGDRKLYLGLEGICKAKLRISVIAGQSHVCAYSVHI